MLVLIAIRAFRNMQDTATSLCKPAHAIYRRWDWVDTMVDDHVCGFCSSIPMYLLSPVVSCGLAGAVHNEPGSMLCCAKYLHACSGLRVSFSSFHSAGMPAR